MVTQTYPSDTYEALIGALGTAGLGDTILRIADESAGVSEVFGFWLEDEGSPVLLASSGQRGSSTARASLYVSDFHALDPLMPMVRQRRTQSAISSAQVSARDIPDSVYRRECFDRPGLSEKIAYVRSCGARQYVLNFYRSREHRHRPAAELAKLAKLVMPILRRHGEMLGDEVGLPPLARVRTRIGRTFPLLTPREREVCARTLLGMTAEAIALSLGIGETSVITYRRRAYARYGISGTGEIVAQLL